MKKQQQQQQQHPGGGADPWPHGAPLGGAPPGLGSWKRRVSLLPFLRFSLRDYGFCMATLLVFCLGSLFYQLGGGPPRFLLDLRQYLGKEGRRERGRREVVPGRGWRGEPSAPDTLVLPPPLPRRGSPGGTPASIRAATLSACCLSVCAEAGWGWGAAGLICPAGTPGRDAAYLPPCLGHPVWGGVLACELVCTSVCVCIRAWQSGERRGGSDGRSMALLVTTALSRPALRVAGVGLVPPRGPFCEFCPARSPPVSWPG